MSYVELLLAGCACFVITAACCVITGRLDTERGYDSPFSTLCTVMGLLAVGSAGFVLVLLIPYISAVFLALAALGIILLLVGVGYRIVTVY